MTPPVISRASRGWACSSHILCISCGTPGIDTMTLPSRSTHQPGAVPTGLGRYVPDGMVVACLTLRSGIVRPRRAKNSRSSASRWGWTVELFAHDVGDGFAGQVIFGRPEAARGDDDVGALEGHVESARRAAGRLSPICDT